MRGLTTALLAALLDERSGRFPVAREVRFGLVLHADEHAAHPFRISLPLYVCFRNAAFGRQVTPTAHTLN